MKVDKATQLSAMHLKAHHQKTKETIEETASGNKLKITDAAMMQIAQALLSDASVMSQSIQNANENIAMLQIANGALQNIAKGATRLQELNVRANSATLNDDQRAMVRKEFAAQQRAMHDAMQSATFNNKPLFESASIGTLPLDDLSLGDTDAMERFTKSLQEITSSIGSEMNQHISSIDTLLVTRTNTLAAYSQMADTDIAKSVTTLKKEELSIQTASYAHAHGNVMDAQRVQTLLS